MRVDTGFGGINSVFSSAKPQTSGSLLQGELGSFIVTCNNGDLRMLPDGVGVYSDDGFQLVSPEPWVGLQGRGAVIEELYHAIFSKKKVIHDGRWAKATMEVCLAMIESAGSRKEVMLNHQVPTLDFDS